MGALVFSILIALIPLCAVAVAWRGDSGIAERHHSHHETYLVPRVLTSAIMLMMVFVGVLGIVIGWLCEIGVFKADARAVYAFFLAFLFVTFLMWRGMRRYRVTTYDDHLAVITFLGKRRTIRYADIDRMVRLRSLIAISNRSIMIYAREKKAFLWGTIDLEQVLTRIDRFDVLESPL